MNTKGFLKALNFFLFIALIFSIGGHVETGHMTGNFFEEESNPTCNFQNDGNSTGIPVDRCCLELAQTTCSTEDGKTICGTDEQNYSLNQDAVNYCEEKGVDLG